MMFWQIYNDAIQIRETQGLEAALSFLQNCDVTPIKFPELHTLRANYLRDFGFLDESLELLQSLYRIKPDDYWINFGLHGAYSARKRWKESMQHMHQAHSSIGWAESAKNGYFITNDYFSPNIPKWKKYFEHMKGQPGLRFLEIGSWQGGSAAWLLDNILTADDAQIVCIDTFEGSSEHAFFVDSLPQSLEQLFDANMHRSGSAHKVKKMKGYSQNVLRGISNEIFDMIYIDGAHESKYVIQDAVLTFSLLGPDSLLLFDDYNFSFPNDRCQNTANAIDFFIEVMSAEFKVIEKDRQVLLRKL